MKPAIIRPELELKHEIKEVPARNVIYLRLFGDYKLNDYCSAWTRLCQFIQEEKLPMGEVMPYCIYHDDPKVTPAEKLRTDVCMVLPSFATAKGDIGFNSSRQAAMPYSYTKVHTNICRPYTTPSTGSISPKWNVAYGMSPVRNVT